MFTILETNGGPVPPPEPPDLPASAGCVADMTGGLATTDADETDWLCDQEDGPRDRRREPPGSPRGGKSELRKAGCRVTPGRREATESAAESRPPMASRSEGHRQG